mgnify:CR=1 FL=1
MARNFLYDFNETNSSNVKTQSRTLQARMQVRTRARTQAKTRAKILRAIILLTVDNLQEPAGGPAPFSLKTSFL